jgi:hypothetical protein
MQDDLVRRLSTGRHPLNASRAASAEDVRKSLQRGFILLRFPETRGGTELKVAVDERRSILTEGDFAAGRGTIQLVGHLSLDDQDVELHATLDLATLQGHGALSPSPQKEARPHAV